MHDPIAKHRSTRRALLRTSALAASAMAVRSSALRLYAQQADQTIRPAAAQPQIDEMMRAFLREHSVPSASLAFLRGMRVLYASAYSTGVAENSPVSTGTRFRIASCSKAFTAAAILQLVEQGRLGLDSTVFGKRGLLSEYATDVPHRDWVETITVHQLLTHTGGGWSNSGNDPMFERPRLDHHELIAWTLQSHPLEYAPGTHYAYSNFGYCLLGRVIEKLTGQPYARVVQERVLAPLGIRDMQIGTNDPAPNEAHYFSSTGNPDQPYRLPTARMDSHGGWIATPTDLATFLSGLYLPASSTTPRPILNPASLHTMTTGTPANPNYGCGLSVNAAGNVWHNGSLPGTGSIMVHTHTGLSWAVTLNRLDQDSNMLGQLDALLWKMARSVPSWGA